MAAIRYRLHGMGVPAGSGEVPAAIASQLAQLKDALARAAVAAFNCAGVSASAETVQTLLAQALHANLAPGTDVVQETTGKQDVGAYGADLAVQVFQLFVTPRLFQVTFRYNLECGDDNLLLVFRAASETSTDGWQQELRYGAVNYKTVGDALGDFVLLSPLTGNTSHPRWRYLVAHGHPACGDTPRPSEFTLDLLTPTDDPARPALSWHYAQAYTAGEAMPRLATTEDTIDFRLIPTDAVKGTHPADKGADAGKARALTQAAVYQFHLTAEGHVEPTHAEANAALLPEAVPKP